MRVIQIQTTGRTRLIFNPVVYIIEKKFKNRLNLRRRRVFVEKGHKRAHSERCPSGKPSFVQFGSINRVVEVNIHTHPYTTAACAAGVVTKTTDRDSLRYTYNGTPRVRQLALGCESS